MWSDSNIYIAGPSLLALRFFKTAYDFWKYTFQMEKIVLCLQIHSGTEKNYFSPFKCILLKVFVQDNFLKMHIRNM